MSARKYRVRQGRPPKWLSYSYDQCADKAFNLSGVYLEQVKKNWANLSFEEQSKAMSITLPLALKRIPDKQEVLQLTVNVPQESINKLIESAERNLLIYNDLKQELLNKNPDLST